jgi:hypothetical protein
MHGPGAGSLQAHNSAGRVHEALALKPVARARPPTFTTLCVGGLAPHRYCVRRDGEPRAGCDHAPCQCPTRRGAAAHDHAGRTARAHHKWPPAHPAVLIKGANDHASTRTHGHRGPRRCRGTFNVGCAAGHGRTVSAVFGRTRRPSPRASVDSKRAATPDPPRAGRAVFRTCEQACLCPERVRTGKQLSCTLQGRPRRLRARVPGWFRG